MGHDFIGQDSVSLRSLLNELRSYPPLSREEEQTMGLIISTAPLDEDGRPTGEGVREAINSLVVHNMKFAIKEAGRYTRRGVPIDDLISATVPNMIRAAEKFEPGRGKFISYARHWVRTALQRCVSNDALPVTLPDHASSLISVVLNQMDRDIAEFGHPIMDVEHISNRSGRNERDVVCAISAMQRTASMDVAWVDNRDCGHEGRKHYDASRQSRGLDTLDVWEDTKAPRPDAIAEQLDNRRVVEMLLSCLSIRQMTMVRAVYLEGRAPVSLAAEYGVTRQAIDWTLGKALKKARARAEKLQQMGVI